MIKPAENECMNEVFCTISLFEGGNRLISKCVDVVFEFLVHYCTNISDLILCFKWDISDNYATWPVMIVFIDVFPILK